MKKLLYILLIFPLTILGQTTSQNYVKTSVYREETQTSDPTKAKTAVTYYDGLGRPIQKVVGKASATEKDIVTHMEYDDFGRLAKTYLPYPAATNDLSFGSGSYNATLQYYSTATGIEHTGNPYSQQFLEPSPLNRMLKQAGPGDAWKGNISDNNDHTVKFAYLFNRDNDNVRKLRAVASWNSVTEIYDITFTNDGMYTANQLYKTISQNENKTGDIYISGSTSLLKLNTVEEFKNRQGQLILKKTFNKMPNGTGEALYTNYIYDQFGNLTYVLPPKIPMMTIPPQSDLDLYCYQYKYDSRNRLAEKKLPGRQWEYIVYDSQDRVVATGPALSPFGSPGTTPEQGWLITRYDSFGRVAYTGWKSEGTTTFTSGMRKTMQDVAVAIAEKTTSAVSIDNIQVYYTDTFASGTKLLTVNYYDNYVFPGAPSAPSGSIEGQSLLTNCKGLPTGSWVRALTTSTETLGQLSYTFYDAKGRPIRSYDASYLGGYTTTDSKLDFDGSLLYNITKHKRIAADNELTVREDFEYSAQDRLISHSHKINSLDTEPLAAFTYNELGQVTQKSVGTTGGSSGIPIQNMKYKYNIRGWLTDINNVDALTSSPGGITTLFAFRIGYNTITDPVGDVVPLYNGNIAETYWRSSSDNVQRKYSYEYDELNRLTDAYYQKPQETIQLNNSYNESVTYDKNSNILTLKRNGGLDDPNTVIAIDDLAYGYIGNQLMRVTDATNSPQGFKEYVTTSYRYSYDVYGNMKVDKNKGITDITYNHLNLPVEIVFSGSNKKINYLYNAAGVKLKKTVTDGNTNVAVVDYLGGFQYKGGALQFFPTSEGYVDNTVTGGTNNFNYVYQYKDHLGNVRMNFAYKQAFGLVIKEESHYYPFGLKHMNYNMDEWEYQNEGGDIVLGPPPVTPTGKLPNNYKYNGKELQDELGLNMYDYGARNYDSALGRWMNVDPKAEVSRGWSPYVYAYDNPMRFIDPDGMMAIDGDDWFKNNFTGEATYIPGATEDTKVEGYTYMCAECEKYEISPIIRPQGPLSEGNVLYQADGSKLPLMDGLTIPTPAPSQSGNGNGGLSFGLSMGGAMGGGIGFELGLVKDFATDNWAAYFSFKSHVGLGGGVGVNASVITPTGKDDFLISDFAGTSMEFSGGINTPLGGGGYSYGGTSPKPGNGILDRISKIGQGPRGYTTGSISPELSGPSAKVSVGALTTKTESYIWDF
ncbi:type IV secretion protein Rhs [Flavobacterium album]|uniref:Type IV secretion protein Rhs n=1 Tax=Flavobacterium album TaxID=2175091 RepID=A0A2S1R1B8_9FLAO|nr:DUF6443 domain-containing protein [Flavobacterium album]AWH86376.1 type IV secretion protein Rhs [Flavobacterium album]